MADLTEKIIQYVEKKQQEKNQQKKSSNGGSGGDGDDDDDDDDSSGSSKSGARNNKKRKRKRGEAMATDGNDVYHKDELVEARYLDAGMEDTYKWAEAKVIGYVATGVKLRWRETNVNHIVVSADVATWIRKPGSKSGSGGRKKKTTATAAAAAAAAATATATAATAASFSLNDQEWLTIAGSLHFNILSWCPVAPLLCVAGRSCAHLISMKKDMSSVKVLCTLETTSAWITCVEWMGENQIALGTSGNYSASSIFLFFCFFLLKN